MGCGRHDYDNVKKANLKISDNQYADVVAGVDLSVTADFINLRLKSLKGSSSTENKVITNALERYSATRIKIETCTRCV
jgi:hypothetical protein